MRPIASGLFCLFLLSISPTAHACSCLPPPPPLEALADADAVFAGQVVSLSSLVPLSCDEHIFATITNDACWKGALGDQVAVSTPGNEACCGFTFEMFEEYLVYAWWDEPTQTYSTHLCARTKPLAWADEDLLELGDPGCAVPVTSKSWGMVKALYDYDLQLRATR